MIIIHLHGRPLPGTSSVITLLVEVKQPQGYTHLFSAIYFGPYFTPKGPKLYLNFPKNQRFISYIDDTWSDVIWTNMQVGNGSWMEDDFFPFQKDDFQVNHVKLWEGNFSRTKMLSNRDFQKTGNPNLQEILRK